MINKIPVSIAVLTFISGSQAVSTKRHHRKHHERTLAATQSVPNCTSYECKNNRKPRTCTPPLATQPGTLTKDTMETALPPTHSTLIQTLCLSPSQLAIHGNTTRASAKRAPPPLL